MKSNQENNYVDINEILADLSQLVNDLQESLMKIKDHKSPRWKFLAYQQQQFNRAISNINNARMCLPTDFQKGSEVIHPSSNFSIY